MTMKQAVAVVPEASLIALLRQRPTPLAAAILATEQIPGFRYPQWVSQPLDGPARAAVEGALQEIDQRLAPARREWVIAILMRLAVGSYPEVTKDQHGFGIRLNDLADDLVEFSEPHIVLACTDWRKSEQWFPKEAELRSKLVHIRAIEHVHQHRAQVLLGLKDARPWELPRKEEPAPVQVDVGQAMAALGKRMSAGARR